jgi:hypothetical protein
VVKEEVIHKTTNYISKYLIRSYKAAIQMHTSKTDTHGFTIRGLNANTNANNQAYFLMCHNVMKTHNKRKPLSKKNARK